MWATVRASPRRSIFPSPTTSSLTFVRSHRVITCNWKKKTLDTIRAVRFAWNVFLLSPIFINSKLNSHVVISSSIELFVHLRVITQRDDKYNLQQSLRHSTRIANGSGRNQISDYVTLPSVTKVPDYDTFVTVGPVYSFFQCYSVKINLFSLYLVSTNYPLVLSIISAPEWARLCISWHLALASFHPRLTS